MSQIRDTVVLNESIMDETVTYDARDSIHTDLKNQIIFLYGDAHVTTPDLQISAGLIVIDLKQNEVTAQYAYDKDSNRVEFPVFENGGESMQASKVKYNFDTEKAYIEDVKIKQDEMYLYMATAKRQKNEELHFKNGRFTTCDLDEPHYHFQLSKAVLVPDKRIATGPVNLYLAGVPTPIGLPMSIIPQQKERTHGLLFPNIAPITNYGFGLDDLGYYFPINEHWQTSAYVDIYTRGSWGLGNMTEYAYRYRFQGQFDLRYNQFRDGFPTNNKQNKAIVQWTHRQDANSNPFWNFSANVNFQSDNQTKNNLDPNNAQYFSNALKSDINLVRKFPNKPFNAGAKLSLEQSSTTKNISLNSPTLNFNTNRLFLFKQQPASSILGQLTLTYGANFKNTNLFADTLLRDGDFGAISPTFNNGFTHNFNLQTNAGLFKNTVKLNPSIRYSNNLNFQQTRKSYDAVLNQTVNDTVQQIGVSQQFSANLSATTVVYAYYRFVGKKKPLLRHLLTPNVSFSYAPNLNTYITDSVGTNQALVTYSPFERSAFSSGVQQNSGLISFSVNNTFELKRKSDKDTVDGFKRTRIIDALTFSANYDLFKDSMNWSNISGNMRIQPKDWLSFVVNSSFSLYDWDSTGATLSDYALQTTGKLGRFLSTNLATNLTFTSKKGYEKMNRTQDAIINNWNQDLNFFLLNPQYLVDFTIPWKVTLSHVLDFSANQSISSFNPERLRTNHTLTLTSDVSLTPRWKVMGVLNTDIKQKQITNFRLDLNRDLHCWQLSFSVTPIGTNKNFFLSIRNKSSLFSDAKLDFRKPPAFF